MNGSPKWSKENDARLIELERQKLTWNEIGERLGVSGNSAKHRARRIGIPLRDFRNFVRSADKKPRDKKPRKVKVVHNTLPELPSQLSRKVKEAHFTSLLSTFQDTEAPLDLPMPRLVPADRDEGCRYPLWGDFEYPTHRYCNAPRILGKSLCVKCYDIVFTKQSRD